MRRVGYANLERAGRFGNSLWEIASTLGIARAHGVDPVFAASYSYRPWLSLPDHWFDDRELTRARDACRLSGMPPAQRPYLQSWELVAPVIDEVREAFAPSREAVAVLAEHLRVTGQAWLLDHLDAVTLHVRRGDNTDPETHPVGSWPLVTGDYYAEALDVLDPQAEATVVVFSDDPGWCMENMADSGRELLFVTDGPTRPPDYEPDAYRAAPALDWIDLQLMAMFTGGHVIANSTYSLWGALLGPAPTVYPDNWVGWRARASLPPEPSMVPPDWVMVHNPVPAEHLTPG